MTTLVWLCGGVAVTLLVYLFVALLAPEKLQ